MSWKATTLSQIAANIQTGPFGSQLHQSDYSDSGFPVVMPKDLVNGHISESSIARVEKKHVDRLSRHILRLATSYIPEEAMWVVALTRQTRKQDGFAERGVFE